MYVAYGRHRYLEIVHGQPDSVELATRTQPPTLLEPLCPPGPEAEEYDHNIKQSRTTAAAFWKPLLEVIPKFQRLHDLILHLPDRFTPGLLAVIEEHHSHCRIHLHHFRFSSLGTHADDWALIRSPNLHSVSVLVTVSFAHDYNDYATFHTIAVAPNLRHVRIFYRLPSSGVSYLVYESFAEWKETLRPLSGSIALFNKLQTLSFCGEAQCGKFVEGILSSVLKFPHLTVLRFPCEGHEFPEELTTHKPFPNLKELDMRIASELYHITMNEDLHTEYFGAFQTVASAFLDSLPPLQSFSFSGFPWSLLLEPVVEGHGPSLTTLILETDDIFFRPRKVRPFRTRARDVEILANHCVNLTKLKIDVPCSLGDKVETRFYEALGNMTNLKEVHIRLECYNADL